jgi:transcriptional regulatory protein GAL4
MKGVNTGSQDCYDVIMQLCGPFLETESSNPADLSALYPTEESPATQISNVYSMLWPNVNVHEANMIDDGMWDNFMGEDLHMDTVGS